MTRPRAPRAAIALSALALTGGVAIAADSVAPTPASPVAAGDAPAPSQQPIAQPEPDQSAAFAVVDRPRADSDALSAAAEETLRTGPTPDLGAAPSLARRAVISPSGIVAWIVPARGHLCLVTSEGTGACNETSEARRGYLLGISAGDDGVARILGAVPDGVGAITLRGLDGGAEHTRAVGNAFSFETRAAPQQIEWTGPDGPAVIPVAVPGSAG